MAAFVLLRQGRAGALKTLLLEGRVFRGLASTASLSAESGKSDKGLPPDSKKQSPPKHVVDPKERGKLLTTPTAAELSKNLTSPSSYSSIVNQGGTVVSPNRGDNVLFTDDGVAKFLSRKTLVEFPEKVASAFRKQGSDSEALQKSKRVTDSSSSSSSSSNSSDSESDEEKDGSEVDSQLVSKGKGRVSKSEASPSFENRASKISISAKEKTWSPQPQLDLPLPEKPHQAKKGTSIMPLKDKKDEVKPTVPKSQVGEEFMKQNVKEKKLQKIVRSNKIDESQKPFEGKKVSSDRTKSGLSTQPSGGPVPTQLTEETTAGRQLQATPPETRGGNLEKQVPEPDGEVPFFPFKKENLGKQAVEGLSKANKEVLEDQVPMKNLKPVPVPNKDVLHEKTTVLKLEAKGEIMEDSATQVGDQRDTQEPAPAAAPAATPAEPFDNTTYKNLQHHDYNVYTFLDVNLDLSNRRLPQPSSGRESPRH